MMFVGMNDREMSVIDEVFAPDYIVHYPVCRQFTG